ncbi:hypothetical protein KSB_83320 [Ktedonobacter robiniae]|uniref:Amidohydrolase n=1 Tax=Ktedonobacter robiniae TaxID=2778365 RepID=A0ABQ3V4G1_9CHLR|nr:hypothetical protein KSB_83320 [Ktedonobacter robiniae]
MLFAIDIPHFGPFSDPHLVAELAHEAEEAGFPLGSHQLQTGWSARTAADR